MRLIKEIKSNSYFKYLTVWRVLEFIIALLLMSYAVGFLLALVLLSPELMQNPEFWMDGTKVLIRAVKVWLCFFLIFLALTLFSGKKKTVLYLRRFRSELSVYFTQIIEDGLGRNFRIITLDDAKFKSLEVPNIEKWLSRIVPQLILIAVFPFIVSMMNMWVAPGSLQEEGYGYSLQYETTIMFAFFFVNLWILLILILAHRYRIRRNSKLKIQNQRDLDYACYIVAKLRYWFLRSDISAPQATVMTVSDDLWRTAVIRLKEESEVALIDLSEPSENLIWEIKHILDSDQPHVFIAEATKLEDWLSSNKQTLSEGENLTEILKEQEILTYRANNDNSACSNFRKNLNRALENTIESKIRSNHQHNFLPLIFKDCIKTTGFYIIIFFAALISGLFLGEYLRIFLLLEFNH